MVRMIILVARMTTPRGPVGAGGPGGPKGRHFRGPKGPTGRNFSKKCNFLYGFHFFRDPSQWTWGPGGPRRPTGPHGAPWGPLGPLGAPWDPWGPRAPRAPRMIILIILALVEACSSGQASLHQGASWDERKLFLILLRRDYLPLPTDPCTLPGPTGRRVPDRHLQRSALG